MRSRVVVLGLFAVVGVARADESSAAKPVLVPYRLTKTNHVLVRAKINNKGPYNFILDTGAPALFVAKKTAEAAGVRGETRGWATLDRFEVEGGVVVEAAKARVDDLFQLEGMNGLGLAGVELHGVIGYNVLARYRVEYDFTRPKLGWTKLDFEPPPFGAIGGRSAPAGLEVIGGMLKMLGAMMGVRANFAVQPRGFLGVELADDPEGVRIGRVTAGAPASGELKVGDVIKRVGGAAIKSRVDLARALADKPEKEKVTIAVVRDGQERQVTLELGRGL